MRKRKTKGEYSGAETIYLRDGGKIIIPRAPIKAHDFDVNGVFASFISRDLIGRSGGFYYASCGFDEPGRLDAPDAFNAFDLLDELLAYTLAGVKAYSIPQTLGHA
jgi:hypothetical protein